MDHRIVNTLFVAFLKGVFVIILEGVGKAVAHCKVAGCVLIEQRVVEQKARIGNGAIVRNERTFAKVSSAFVHGDHFLQECFALLGTYFNGLAILKAHPEVFDQLTLIRKGLGRINDTLGNALLGGDENFLGGNVGVEYDTAALCSFAYKYIVPRFFLILSLKSENWNPNNIVYALSP